MFQYLLLENRLSNIILQISKHDPDIASIFEVRSHMVPSVTIELEKLNYKVYSFAYNPNQIKDTSFYFIIGYKKLKFKLLNKYMYWCTDTPFIPLNPQTRAQDKILKQYQEPFEKGSLISTFQNKSTNEIFIHSANHFGLKKDYQIIQCIELINHLKLLNQKIIVTGDFNTFPDFKGEIIDIFIDNGFNHPIDPEAPFTFLNNPCDFGNLDPDIYNQIYIDMELIPAEQIRSFCINKIFELYGGPLTSTLDHVFTLGNFEAICKIDIDIDLNNLREKYIEKSLAGIPVTDSDHMLLLVSF
jgi:hypothetical protein